MTRSQPTLPITQDLPSKEFDALAQQSNGDPIPRPLWLNLRLDRWPLTANGLDLLLLEAERLGRRFDRDRDVVGLCCRSESVPDLEGLQSLLESLCRRFHFASRPAAAIRLQLTIAPPSEIQLSLEDSGWQLELGPPWFDASKAGQYDALPLGPAAIGCLAGVLFQNEKEPNDYAEALKAGRLPIAKRLVSDGESTIRQLKSAR